MKTLFPLLLTLSAALAAQPPATAQPGAHQDPKRVVAILEGKPWTADDFERMTVSLGGAIQANFASDPRGFADQLAFLFRLEAIADQEKIAESDPHKWRLLHNRALYLAQARMNAQSTRINIMPEDQKKYFEAHKDEFSNARIRVIRVNFGEKRTEAEAQQLSADIVKQARAGADFASLVEKHSEDAESKAKGGEFPPIKPGDTSLPAPVRTAVFSLKPGEVAEPIRQPAGFWVFRLEAFVPATYEEVRDSIYTKLMDQAFKAWVEELRQTVKVEIKDPSFFKSRVVGTAPAGPPPAQPGAPARQ